MSKIFRGQSRGAEFVNFAATRPAGWGRDLSVAEPLPAVAANVSEG